MESARESARKRNFARRRRVAETRINLMERRRHRTTFVRITTTALRLNPRIRVFAANGTTVRFQTTRTGIYAAVRLDGVAPGTQLFAQISDVSNSACGGIYEFSAGPQVASDDTATAADTIVLVPLIWR